MDASTWVAVNHAPYICVARLCVFDGGSPSGCSAAKHLPKGLKLWRCDFCDKMFPDFDHAAAHEVALSLPACLFLMIYSSVER